MIKQPRYPIYIPSKGRADHFHTAKMFMADGVDFRVVVEPNEIENYKAFKDRLLVLPENNRGLVYARNWIKDHAISEGHERHWQFDDDIRNMSRIYKGYRISTVANIPLIIMEDFINRYENVVLSSFNSKFFIIAAGGNRWTKHPPFLINYRCYTCFLMLNSIPNRWRFRYNEDTDMTLQVLADGWCTILMNAFLINTEATMISKGGQTSIYVNDGRLQMARQLERVWPGVVTTKRRFGRPQHSVNWSKFTTPLKLKPGIDLKKIKPNDYGLRLKAIAPIKDEGLKKLIKNQK